MNFHCLSCSAALEPTAGVVTCAYCGRLNQIAPVVLADSLRIETLDDAAPVLIPRWTTLPTMLTEVFSTGQDQQHSVGVHILQGGSERVSQNRSVGEFIFGGIAPAPRATPRIQFTFELREDGRLTVTAVNLETQKEQVFPAMQVEIMRK